MITKADQDLFIFYKSYRSNIRAKVNSLRSRSSKNETEKKFGLADADKYLCLMDGYIRQLDVS